MTIYAFVSYGSATDNIKCEYNARYAFEEYDEYVNNIIMLHKLNGEIVWEDCGECPGTMVPALIPVASQPHYFKFLKSTTDEFFLWFLGFSDCDCWIFINTDLPPDDILQRSNWAASDHRSFDAINERIKDGTEIPSWIISDEGINDIPISKLLRRRRKYATSYNKTKAEIFSSITVIYPNQWIDNFPDLDTNLRRP